MQELEDSLACIHTATDAATALNRIYSTMQEKAPEGGLFLKRWARVLLRPELRHVESACDALEQALLGRPADPVPPDADIAGVNSILAPAQLSCPLLRPHDPPQHTSLARNCVESAVTTKRLPSLLPTW